MRILLAEDSGSKIKAVVDHLTQQCGIPRDEIEIAHCAHDARNAMSKAHFDLLILDVLLPLRSEDDPKQKTSLDLLDELATSGLYNPPKKVIGLTAYQDILGEVSEHFAEHLWTILFFEESASGWRDSLERCINYMVRAESVPLDVQYATDLCVITALQDPEMEAILRLPWNWAAAEPIDDCTFVRKGRICTEVNGSHSVVAAVAPRMGMVATAILASKMISHFRPRVLVMAGICAGVRNKTNLGDVIFAEHTWDYQSGKRVRDNENSQFSIAPHQLPALESIRAKMEQLGTDSHLWHEIRNQWPTRPQHELRLISGPMASGSAVLADGQVVADIKQQHRNLIAIEMEAYGLYAAAAYASAPRPTTFAIKSVCDFADPDKKDDAQAYAAFTSAHALQAFAERFLCDRSLTG